MMSRKKKILIVFHLCFALAFFCWLLIQPYVKEVVAQKSELTLYEMTLEREAFFETLTPEKQHLLTEGYVEAQKKQKPSLLKEVGNLFFISTPAFALAWLFFSLAICILLLFRIEGASLAVWLLPLIVLGYAYFLYASAPPQRESLFPSEDYVLSRYVEPSEYESMNRRKSLLLGWHRYLIHEWAGETPSEEEETYQTQLEKGLFAFNVARLEWIITGKGDEIVTAGFTTPPSILRVACYFIWNLFFAWYINRKEKHTPSAVASSLSY